MSFTKKYTSKFDGLDFSTKIIRERALVYYITIRKLNNKVAWHIFEVEKAKREAFEAIVKSGDAYKFSDYGILHDCGWGEEPPEEVKVEMRKRFGLFT